MILDHFYGDPREQQRIALLELEANWKDYDVFVIRAPTGTGKSRIAHCVAKWSGRGTTVITPDNMLVKQYMDEFDDLFTIWRKRAYHNTREYLESRNHAREIGVDNVLNYTSYIANKSYQPILVVDEAHKIIANLCGEQVYWHHLYGIPEKASSSMDILHWLETDPNPNGSVSTAIKKRKKQLSALYNMLSRSNMHYSTSFDYREYRGKLQPCFVVKDLLPTQQHFYWPRTVKKIILMTATISETDIKDLDLSKRRVKFIDVGSPIPPSQRRVVIDPLVQSVGFKNRNSGMKSLANYIEQKMIEYKGHKGLIHLTYSTAAQLAIHLPASDKIIYHTKDDKLLKFKQWINMPPNSGAIFIACGMQEGIDLADTKARWQVIGKINYPSLVDNAVNQRIIDYPEWYNWQAVKGILQAAGRVCRNPTDWGHTFIVDKSFDRLYSNASDMFPLWFKEAVTYKKRGLFDG